MSHDKTFYGIPMSDKNIKPHKFKGDCLVSRIPVCFIDDIDNESGNVTESSSPIAGENIKGKILVFPHAVGGKLNTHAIRKLIENGNLPKAFIMVDADRDVMTASIISKIPFIYGISPDPFDIMQTGDIISVDTKKGLIKIVEHRGVTKNIEDLIPGKKAGIKSESKKAYNDDLEIPEIEDKIPEEMEVVDDFIKSEEESSSGK